MQKEDIRIKRVIVHIMDSLVGLPVLSDTEIEFGSDFADFLREHIYKIMSSDDCKKCKFYEKESEDNAWEGPGVNIAGTDTVHVCYISGIDYPKGWNWADASDGTESARCSLVVFADGVPMLKLPVGEGYKVSSDPDMHKVIDGHLYTIYCTEGYTSIRKDGKAFLKYEGEENIRELILDEENVHTLGVSRDGRGFAYRKNGDLVMERRTGYAFERLHTFPLPQANVPPPRAL